jgi:maleate isomerase
MNDWKYQLGLIVPSWNTTMEYECWRMAPPGVSIHSARIAHTADTDEALLHMVDVAPESAQLLAHAKVQGICFGCTGASFIKPGIDQDVIKNIEKATNIPATTTSTAMKDALFHLGIKSLSIASPYGERINNYLAEFLRSFGFKVISQKGLDVDCPSFLAPDNAYRVVKEVDRKETEAIVISCTNFRSLEVIEKLEQELSKPVISSNTVSMWKLLQLAGIKEKIPGGGKLLNS